jgi:hypothetical protein
LVWLWLHRPLREQARSHIWNAIPCGSEPAREEAISSNKKPQPSLPSISTIATIAFRPPPIKGTIATSETQRGVHIMIHTITLSVSFPVFGSNYYDQHYVSHKTQALVFNEAFEDLLMPAAINHFSNEVVGINDQFRFLSDILATHLLDIEASVPTRSRVQASAHF